MHCFNHSIRLLSLPSPFLIVTAKASEGMHRRTNGYFFSEDSDGFFSIHDHPTKGPVPLVTHGCVKTADEAIALLRDHHANWLTQKNK